MAEYWGIERNKTEFESKDSILVHSGCYKKKYHKLSGLEKTRIYFSQLRGLKVQDQGAGRFSVLGRPASWFTGSCLFSTTSRGGGGKDLSGPFISALI